MTLTELMLKIRKICPNASFQKDYYGQIVIYTDLIEIAENEELVEYKDSE